GRPSRGGPANKGCPLPAPSREGIMKHIAPVCLFAFASALGCTPESSEAVGKAASASSVSATLRLDNALNGTANHINERCDVDLTWLNQQLGTSIAAGRQIRIGRTGVAGAVGVCTVQNRANAGSVVRMGNNGFSRIDAAAPANETIDT